MVVTPFFSDSMATRGVRRSAAAPGSVGIRAGRRRAARLERHLLVAALEELLARMQVAVDQRA
jgi:hypothetical protein